APFGEYSSIAWKAFAGELEKQGHADQAKVWKERAADPRAFAGLLSPARTQVLLVLCLIVFVAASFSTLIYIFVLSFPYRPQRMQDRAAGGVWNSKPFLTLLRLEYTDRRERAALLAIILLAWTAVGLQATLEDGLVRWYDST